MEMVSIPSRTIDDYLRKRPVVAGNDPPLLCSHEVDGCVDMVIQAPNVPATRPNLVDVLAADCFERELLVPGVISTAKSVHKTTPTGKLVSPTMTGSRAAGGVRQRSMGCPLTSEKMWNSPEERLWMSFMLELGISLTSGRPFIHEGRRGVASPHQHLTRILR